MNALPKLSNVEELEGFRYTDTRLTVVSHPDLVKLNALISSALACQDAARRGDLRDGHNWLALVNAAFDVFEVDGLYDLADDVCHDLRIDREGNPLDDQGEVIWEEWS